MSRANSLAHIGRPLTPEEKKINIVEDIRYIFTLLYREPRMSI